MSGFPSTFDHHYGAFPITDESYDFISYYTLFGDVLHKEYYDKNQLAKSGMAWFGEIEIQVCPIQSINIL